MRKRPPLTKGMICRWSRAGLNKYGSKYQPNGWLKRQILIVSKDPCRDSTDGFTLISILVLNYNYGSKKIAQRTVNRRHLWCTGIIGVVPETMSQKYQQAIPKKNVLGKPVATVCTCPPEVWMNFGCKCGAIQPYQKI